VGLRSSKSFASFENSKSLDCSKNSESPKSSESSKASEALRVLEAIKLPPTLTSQAQLARTNLSGCAEPKIPKEKFCLGLQAWRKN